MVISISLKTPKPHCSQPHSSNQKLTNDSGEQITMWFTPSLPLYHDFCSVQRLGRDETPGTGEIELHYFEICGWILNANRSLGAPRRVEVGEGRDGGPPLLSVSRSHTRREIWASRSLTGGAGVWREAGYQAGEALWCWRGWVVSVEGFLHLTVSIWAVWPCVSLFAWRAGYYHNDLINTLI